ncbi:murein L,D-transpeptidase YafK [Bosea sp. BE271]|uniref:L,D-transpeptidase family protein n=1 Tax=Bosea TaxID=85413 RepID=UPI0028655557|nr:MULTISPECIES: murein L,D-transpeptidase family protein [Bosea]MDR6826327.1 murein L,D-transpeptidase YafK [Bosea robiniae]MDR6893037.1 murein L,D-transpeptidase YafK [Bosea sp. BE109]MDR7137265.1 murein L,D-transpeptidase YafK [Bosea sp. BE168]MDR7173965.1 murein L,D-transpeptidase YafK [Bosea sp. BE271]
MDISALRSLAKLAAVLTLGASILSGCIMAEGDDRHLQPLPVRLVSEMSSKGMSQGDPILIRIFKKESELEVWKRDRSGQYALLKTYPMCRWSGQLGPKKREGDRQAPEGFYTVTADLMNPRSQFYLSFNLGYPNALDQAQGFSGSALMVHGACTSSGCFAMTDEGVTEIFGLAREAFAGGQRSFQVQALPFRMTPENMARHRNNPNFAFWQNLKEGVDHFDATRQPPRLAACGRRYVFNARDGAGRMDPGAACPPYEIDPEVQPLVSRKQERDQARFAELVGSGSPATSYAYLDGGMHKSFRSMLKDLGPERMQPMVAGKVEISRPEAALADPFNGDDGLGRADKTGSLPRR